VRAALAPLAPLLTALLAAGAAGAEQTPARIYGLEIERRGASERLLVFADRSFEYEIAELAPDRVLLSIPWAALDDTAPTALRGRAGAIALVSASERRGAQAPEVRIEVVRARGAPAQVEQRGAILALAFPAPQDEQRVELRVRNEDLKYVVEAVARGVGETFIHDEALQGRVTLALAQPPTRAQARALLDAVLTLEGFAALPTPSGAFRIVSLGDGAALAPWRPGLTGEAGEAPVATAVELESADASELAALLSPWLGARAVAVAEPRSNQLVLAASEARLRELLGVVRVLDRSAGEELLVRRLRHRAADDAAELLSGVYGRGDGTAERVQVWSDARSNTLVARASRAQLDELRGWLERLDRPPQVEGVLRVRRVRHADPEALAQTLSELGGAGTRPAAGAGGPERAGPLAGRSFSVVADRPSRSLVIQADPETSAAIEQVLEELDRPAPRVQIEALVLEITTDSSLSLGFDAFLPVTRPNSPDDVIGTVLLDPTGSGLLQPGAGAGPGFAARVTQELFLIPVFDADGNPLDPIAVSQSFVLTADRREVEARVLARPHLLGVSGEEHEIVTGDNIPVPQSAVAAAGGAAGSPFANQTTIQRQDVGVVLRVKPTLGQGGRVRLELDVETSRLGESSVGDPDEVGPTIRKRHVTTTVWIADDEVAVVGLGRFPELQTTLTGVPWLREIPLLGHLFRAETERRLDAHLVVAVQARALPDDSELVAETIRRRLALARVVAREGGLSEQEGPWALRVATRSEAGDAEAIAASFAAPGERARVLRWEGEGHVYYDVYLVGFASAAEASEAARRVRERGLRSELVPVRGARLPE
jgi:general secretion pathway protein D